MTRFLPIAIISVVLVLAAGGGLLLFRAKSSTTPLKILAGEPGAEPAHVRGGAKAQVTLEEFGDYQCAPCGRLAPVLLTVEHDYGSRMRIVFRQFPLKMHPYGMMAASAAEAAGLQGHFWEMHDLLFQNALTWGKEGPRPFNRRGSGGPPLAPILPEEVAAVRSVFEGYASQIGLDMERFKKDMDSEEVRARISADQQRGFSIGVDRTPVLFVDGISIPFDSLKLEPLHKLIDQALGGQTPVPESPTPSPRPGGASSQIPNLEPISSPSP